MHARTNIENDKYRVYSRFEGNTLMFTYVNQETALQKSNELNVAFYSKNKDKLPKGITIDAKHNRFRFHARLNADKVKHIYTSTDLDEIIKMRSYMIKNLLSLF